MSKFTGFTSSETFTQIPDTFFHLLKEVEDAVELKVTLYALWRIEHIEGNFRALCESDFETESLGLNVNQIHPGLKQSGERGTLLKSAHATDCFYFLTSPPGRLAADGFATAASSGPAQLTT